MRSAGRSQITLTAAAFSDPDGNGRLLQGGTIRLPGRFDLAETAFALANDLGSALRRAFVRPWRAHEKCIGKPDANRPD